MQLKGIELKGFKSFPEKTNINFKKGITGIVGPNGSGKSNISDAVRWALGEQSAKTLRGDKMEDVIFSGTEERKPLGFSEVTVSFDNSKGEIPIDYEEVAITRRVFRSGESEYYINKNACRLKDIRELLMDTGIGKEGYSIIGQGRIEGILSNRSEDRRNIFEEAAGIVKYKSKKEESEKKLKRTEDNLTRINDLVLELKKQERTLESQARKANEYKGLYDELREIELGIYAYDIRETKYKKNKIENELLGYSKILNENTEEINRIKSKINSRKEELEKNNLSYNNENEKKHMITNEIQERKKEVSVLKEKEKFNLKDSQRIELENQDLEREILKKEEENKNSRVLKESKAMELDSLIQKSDEDSNILAIKSKELKEKETLIEKEKNRAIDIYNGISDNKSKINSINSFYENINKRKDQILKFIEEEKATYKELKDLKYNTKAYVDKLKDDLLNLKDKYKTDIKLFEDLEIGLKNIEEKLQKNNIEIQTNISNYKVYRNMEDSYEGYYRGVKEALKARDRDKSINQAILGVVADLISVKEEYEIAINTALGGSSQNIVTKNQNSAKYLIDYLRTKRLGRVTCLPLDIIKGNTVNINSGDREEFNIIGIGSEIVEFDERYRGILENLLGRTIIIKDLASGIKLSNKYRNSLRIVTIEGDLINPGGSMTGGSQGKNTTNIISRKNRMERIKNEVIELREVNRDLSEKRQGFIKKIRIDKEEINLLSENIKDTEYILINKENEYSNLKQESERLEREISNKEKEIESLYIESNTYEKDKLNYTEKINSLNLELTRLQNNIDSLNSETKNLEEFIVHSRDIVTENKININRKRDEVEVLTNKIEENTLSIKNNREKIKENKVLKENLNISLDRIGRELVKKEGNIKVLEEKLLLCSEKLNTILKAREEIHSDLGSSEELYELSSGELKSIEDKTIKLDLSKAKKDFKIESLLEGLKEEYDLSYDDLKDPILENTDIENARVKSKKLKDRIKTLGNINLNAIEEYDELLERLEFISDQQKDLNKSKNDLNKVIGSMEKEMEEKFLESFNLIKENFKEIFQVFFSGGKAELILSDENDLLNTGIEIEAQPPGKRLQNLNSLSGGERSLTAVALLFSILKMKPAPFCILDEIDAALDEANITRYTDYLKKISDETQFIIITHRKRTMEIADVLYGITMEEKGVSKLVAVELTDYEEEEAS